MSYNLFNVIAQARPAPKGGMDIPQMVIFFGGFLAIMYFMMIRPQRKQQKDRQTMLDSLQKGDKVITTGGMYGTLTEVNDTSVKLRVAEGVILRLSRAAIAGKTQKDDEENSAKKA
jgi:preprotein translocase subunit YajC